MRLPLSFVGLLAYERDVIILMLRLVRSRASTFMDDSFLGSLNVTDRARYYTLYPWLIWAFDQAGYTTYDFARDGFCDPGASTSHDTVHAATGCIAGSVGAGTGRVDISCRAYSGSLPNGDSWPIPESLSGDLHPIVALDLH